MRSPDNLGSCSPCLSYLSCSAVVCAVPRVLLSLPFPFWGTLQSGDSFLRCSLYKQTCFFWFCRDYTNPYLPVAASANDPSLASQKKEPESNVLLASIENMQYEVTLDVLHTVCETEVLSATWFVAPCFRGTSGFTCCLTTNVWRSAFVGSP